MFDESTSIHEATRPFFMRGIYEALREFDNSSIREALIEALNDGGPIYEPLGFNTALSIVHEETFAEFHESIYKRHNELRAKHCVEPLKIDKEAERIAQEHANWLARNDKEGLNNWLLLVMFQAFSVIAV